MPAIEQLNFISPALADLAAAFRRRSKAVRYHGKLMLSREAQDNDERLNVDCCDLAKLALRLSVWSSGDWWLLACKPRPARDGGWLFKYELRGNLGRWDAEETVQWFEDSMLLTYTDQDCSARSR